MQKQSKKSETLGIKPLMTVRGEFPCCQRRFGDVARAFSVPSDASSISVSHNIINTFVLISIPNAPWVHPWACRGQPEVRSEKSLFGWKLHIVKLYFCVKKDGLFLLTETMRGVSIPFFLKKIGIDPALAGGVMMTTLTDVLGFITFLGLVTLFLPYII